MASRSKTSPPPLALRLRQGNGHDPDVFQLHRPSMQRQHLLEIITFDTARPLTLACAGYDEMTRTFDVAAAVRSGLLELVEQDTHRVVAFPRAPDERAVGRVAIPPRKSPRTLQARVTLDFNTTAPIWNDTLQPHKSYTLRFSPSGGQAWCYYADLSRPHRASKPPVSAFSREARRSDESSSSSEYTNSSHSSELATSPASSIFSNSAVSSHDSRSSVSSSDENLSVRRDDDMIRFTVYDDAAPPTCSATFSLESAVCHGSGTPPFRLITEVTLDGSEDTDGPITVNMSDTPFDSGNLNSVNKLVRCVDVESGKMVCFPFVALCWGGPPPGPDFPHETMFVELWPGATRWRHEYELELNDASKGRIGGLESLTAGKKYRMELSDEVTKYGFKEWMHGTKRDLLRGTTQEKKERWASPPRGRPGIPIRQRNAPVVFDVVD
ncbi:hypothetical protein SLS58_011077 [Diplodia intermedia]|uniref:Uncharacterized protein n=1 Tax=Diplodia intermedia TaxID=856260 RepID=A0ABR3T2B8_9PEZI